jgi:uncharacterized membrane protein YedE/YeeE
VSRSPTPPEEPAPQPMTAKQTYNLVSDTAVGVNVRWKDNLFQALAIFVCLVLGAAIGYVVTPRDVVTGAIFGGFLGLLVGLFGSGLFLMIFRAVMHVRGKHD